MFRQLTHAPHGHMLTNAGVWSPDGEWIVYDVRSDPAGAEFDGTRIERVHVTTGEVQLLYESRRGACCGVASCSPVDNRVAFILGPEDPTPDWQYCAYHRRGVIVDADRPGEITNLDARDLTPPFTPGALRGGSHVHQFSPDGRFVSFTYEDHVLASYPPPSKGGVRGGIPDVSVVGGMDFNQRNVAVALPRPVRVPRTHPRNHDGDYFSVVVTQTTNRPRPHSDEIQFACEEAWIGAGLPRSLAFLGIVVDDRSGGTLELFVVDLPDDLTISGASPLEGTPTRRPAPPVGTRQRRLTFTADRECPGLQGPRHWPRSSPDGGLIAFLMPDDARYAQLWTIAPRGGEPRQLTHDPFPVASAFTWNHDGSQIAYIADWSVMTVDVATGRSRRLTPSATLMRPEACVFSPDGSKIAYVRQIDDGERLVNQIFVATL
jgi:hypothetical protein